VANAVSMSQTQEGFLQVVQKALDRMSTLSLLSQDSNSTATDRRHYTCEFTQLQSFISDIGTKKFNGVALFSDTPLDVTLENSGQKIPLNAIDFNAPSAGGGLANAYDPSKIDLHNSASAEAALDSIRKALANLDAMHTKVGSNLRRLGLSGEQLSVLNENLSAANNPPDLLARMKNLTQTARFKMLRQSGAAMLAQANALPQTALKLLD
jgi:flagellin